MHCTDLREKRLAQCAASRMMRSPPTSYCVAMAAQKSAFPQVRASRCRDATFMAVRSPATFMRQSENSWPNLRVSPVNERRGLQKHSSIPDEARLPLTSRYRHMRKRPCLNHRTPWGSLMLARAARKCASSPSDAKVHLHLLLYPSVEEFGHEKISSAGTLAATRAGW